MVLYLAIQGAGASAAMPFLPPRLQSQSDWYRLDINPILLGWLDIWSMSIWGYLLSGLLYSNHIPLSVPVVLKTLLAREIKSGIFPPSDIWSPFITSQGETGVSESYYLHAQSSYINIIQHSKIMIQAHIMIYMLTHWCRWYIWVSMNWAIIVNGLLPM